MKLDIEKDIIPALKKKISIIVQEANIRVAELQSQIRAYEVALKLDNEKKAEKEK